jgi:hypothetical protein
MRQRRRSRERVRITRAQLFEGAICNILSDRLERPESHRCGISSSDIRPGTCSCWHTRQFGNAGPHPTGRPVVVAPSPRISTAPHRPLIAAKSLRARPSRLPTRGPCRARCAAALRARLWPGARRCREDHRHRAGRESIPQAGEQRESAGCCGFALSSHPSGRRPARRSISPHRLHTRILRGS